MWGRSIFRAFLFTVAISSVGLAQQPLQDRFESIDIYITSYKGPPVKDFASYHQGPAGQQFAQELRSDDDERFCLQSAEFRETAGLWEGNAEPSWWIRVQGDQRNAEAYAAQHAAKYDQESALIFVNDLTGPDTKYVFDLPPAVPLAATLKALQDGGFKGAALAKNQLLVLDPKGEHAQTANELAKALGAKMSTTRGRVRLIMQAEYEPLLQKYKAIPNACSSANP